MKSFFPQMSGLLGTTSDALYTRQRALAELGVLKVVEGRGPGSGTPLTADSVAAIIIALLCADTLQDTDKRVKSMCHARPRGLRTCPMTGANDLRSAVAAILVDRVLCKSLVSVTVHRHAASAQIIYGRPSEALGSIFDVHPMRINKSVIKLRAEVCASTIGQISALLAAATHV